MSLGALYQLIAQVFGLGLLAAAAVFLLAPNPGPGRASPPRRALLAAILVAALGVCYPEAFPFLALAFCLYHSVAIARGKANWKALARLVALTGGFSVVLLNTYTGGAVSFLRNQIGSGAAHGAGSGILFPYYLVPSGLAVFWGFQPVGERTIYPVIDVYILLGICLLAAGAAASLWLTWRGEPAGTVAVVMLAVAARLFVTRSDFGLYKLAMYLQPFLLGAMTLAWFSLHRHGVGRARSMVRKAAFCAPIALIAAGGVPAQQRYVRASFVPSDASAGFVEIPGATRDRIVTRLESLAAKPRREIVLSDSANMPLAKFESPYLSPSSQWYLSRDVYAVSSADYPRILSNWYADLARPGYAAAVTALLRDRRARFVPASFDMHGTAANGFSLERDPGSPGFPVQYTLLASGPRQTILNRSAEPGGYEGRQVRMVPSEQVHDHLVLIESDLGGYYGLRGEARTAGHIAVFQLEPDYFFHGESMSAIGRVLLFQVLNSSRRVRLVVDYTASLNSDGRNAIPPVDVVGDTRASFGATGRGSARLISPPVAPQAIQGRYYISVDMGTDGQWFPEKRAGLMRAFGTDIRLDTRRITGFARDISAIDDGHFAALHPPAVVAHFPNGLRDTNLEYSGIYEDGWVAESSFLRLLQPAQSSMLRIRAKVLALLPHPPALRVGLDGVTVAEVALKTGENDVKIPLAGTDTIRRVELHFDRAAHLSSPDNRPVSVLLRSVGFEDAARVSPDIAAGPITIGDR
jgi:hypothetical protein